MLKLKELLTFVESKVTLELLETEMKYERKTDIPDALKNHEVKRIEAKTNSIFIKLDEPKKVPTLAELGYSFESGM